MCEVSPLLTDFQLRHINLGKGTVSFHLVSIVKLTKIGIPGNVNTCQNTLETFNSGTL